MSDPNAPEPDDDDQLEADDDTGSLGAEPADDEEDTGEDAPPSPAR